MDESSIQRLVIVCLIFFIVLFSSIGAVIGWLIWG